MGTQTTYLTRKPNGLVELKTRPVGTVTAKRWVK